MPATCVAGAVVASRLLAVASARVLTSRLVWQPRLTHSRMHAPGTLQTHSVVVCSTIRTLSPRSFAALVRAPMSTHRAFQTAAASMATPADSRGRTRKAALGMRRARIRLFATRSTTVTSQHGTSAASATAALKSVSTLIMLRPTRITIPVSTTQARLSAPTTSRRTREPLIHAACAASVAAVTSASTRTATLKTS